MAAAPPYDYPYRCGEGFGSCSSDMTALYAMKYDSPFGDATADRGVYVWRNMGGKEVRQRVPINGDSIHASRNILERRNWVVPEMEGPATNEFDMSNSAALYPVQDNFFTKYTKNNAPACGGGAACGPCGSQYPTAVLDHSADYMPWEDTAQYGRGTPMAALMSHDRSNLWPTQATRVGNGSNCAQLPPPMPIATGIPSEDGKYREDGAFRDRTITSGPGVRSRCRCKDSSAAKQGMARNTPYPGGCDNNPSHWDCPASDVGYLNESNNANLYTPNATADGPWYGAWGNSDIGKGRYAPIPTEQVGGWVL